MWKILKCDWLKKCINVIHSGYVERNQNSLISRLCAIRIKTDYIELYWKTLLAYFSLLFIGDKNVLAIEYFQIILTLWINKSSYTFYSHTHFRVHNFLFFLIRISPCFSPLSILTKENYNFFTLKCKALQFSYHQQKQTPNVPLDSSHKVSFSCFIWSVVFFLVNTKRRT